MAVISARLPSGPNTKKISAPSESRTNISNEYSGLRGVYIWTNILTGNQYVGSSNNLGTRLGQYFQLAYLRKQTTRGSAISRALLKHGMALFTLEVTVFGPSLNILTPHANRDYLALEQQCLDKFTLAYNVNRTATGSAYNNILTSGSESPNSGSNNASFGLMGPQSFAWGQRHGSVLIQHYSDTRGSHLLYVYSSTTFTLSNLFTSGKAFSSAMGYSATFVLKVMKTLSASASGAVIFGSYIITTVPCTPGMLEAVFSSLTTVQAPALRSYTNNSTTIYGLHVGTGELFSWESKEKCTFAISGRTNVNKATMNKRLNTSHDYYGYLLRTTPFPSSQS
jgi:hypothetical protein